MTKYKYQFRFSKDCVFIDKMEQRETYQYCIAQQAILKPAINMVSYGDLFSIDLNTKQTISFSLKEITNDKDGNSYIGDFRDLYFNFTFWLENGVALL